MNPHADREALRAEARADRKAFQAHILRLTEQQGVLTAHVENIRSQLAASSQPRNRLANPERGLPRFVPHSSLRPQCAGTHSAQRPRIEVDSNHLRARKSRHVRASSRDSSVHDGLRKGGLRGFLDLFRAWFNLRTRRWGRRKGTSAHESLTGQRVHDWLTWLGYPPSPALT